MSVTVAVDQTCIGEAFEKGQSARDVQMGADGESVVLYDLTLVEDDGPGACGVPDHAAPTTVRGDVRAKKVLHLDRAGASSAWLAFLAGPLHGETRPLEVTVNGRRLLFRVAQHTTGTLDWPAVRIPVGLLRQGDNDVVLSCQGERGWRVTVAQREDILRNAPDRRSRPNRSFRSVDGGQTWSAGLGDDGGQDGELMARLHLGQYVARGELIGPVIDLAALAAEGSSLAPEVSVRSVRVRTRKKLRAGTGIGMFLRSGDTPVYDPGSWGEWRLCGVRGSASGDLKRFVQWRAVLTTTKPKTTPALQAVQLEAQVEPRPSDWATRLKLTGSHNEEIRYTSIPFEYETFDEPQLVELRNQYRLDDVVAGAKSELETMTKLRNWVSAQWKYDPPVDYYPAWDAREIIPLRKGFCVQYAIVYMQCALSLGMQTRFVFGYFPQVWVKGNWVCGHEVNEYWSNDLGRWVMMDAHQDECFVDRRTGVLTNMLELHEDQLDTYFPDGIIDERPASFDDERPSEGVLRWKGAEPSPNPEKPKLDIKWGYLHWMPRNNFYAHRFPEPLYQGRNWTWTGYWLWEDDRTPRQRRFGRYTRRRSDIEWTINQVRWAAAPAERPGTIRLIMGTVTPDFDTFLVSVDRGAWQPSADGFDWTLHAGTNRIEMRVRNRAGVLGRTSWIELQHG